MDERTLREWTAPWPGVAAEVKWEDDLAFGVAGRMFCVLCLRGADAGRISFKVDDDRFLAMTDRRGFAPAPYLARAKWVTLARPQDVPAAELRALVRRSYELVRARLTKKQQRELAD